MYGYFLELHISNTYCLQELKIVSMLIVLGFGVIVHQVLLFGCSFRAPIPTCQQLRWLK